MDEICTWELKCMTIWISNKLYKLTGSIYKKASSHESSSFWPSCHSSRTWPGQFFIETRCLVVGGPCSTCRFQIQIIMRLKSAKQILFVYNFGIQLCKSHLVWKEVYPGQVLPAWQSTCDLVDVWNNWVARRKTFQSTIQEDHLLARFQLCQWGSFRSKFFFPLCRSPSSSLMDKAPNWKRWDHLRTPTVCVL